MEATLAEWGNSTALRIPKSALKEAGLSTGDKLEVKVEKGALVLRRKTSRLDDLLTGVEPGMFAEDPDFEDGVGREAL